MLFLKKLINKFPILNEYQKKIRLKIGLKFIKNPEELVDIHFKFASRQGFQNIDLFKQIFKHSNSRPMNIFETGSSAYWGANSSLLFDNYVKRYGGQFITVDIRKNANEFLNKNFSQFSKSYVGDSLNFIKKLNKKFLEKLDIVYLDSFDLDVNNPQPSMEHTLKEFIELDKHLSVGCLVAIDDTPNEKAFKKYLISELKSKNNTSNFKTIPGKGALILTHKTIKKYRLIYQYYGVLLKKIK